MYLEDFEPEALCAQLDQLLDHNGFSGAEASLADVESAARFAIDLTSRQGGKLAVVCGGAAEFVPKVPDSDKTRRGFFYSSEHGFSRLAADMHKFFTSVDLYVFGHRRNKNLGSLGEFVRLGGGDLCYYDGPEPAERLLTSCQVLQRPAVQRCEAEELGDGVPDPLLGGLAEDELRQLLRELLQRPPPNGAAGRVP